MTNAASDDLTVFAVVSNGGLDRIGSAPDADPAQVGITPDGSALIVTERGTDSISAVPVQAGGTLGTRRTVASSGPTPYGFALTSNGTLVVTEAFRAQKGAAAASSRGCRTGGDAGDGVGGQRAQ